LASIGASVSLVGAASAVVWSPLRLAEPAASVGVGEGVPGVLAGADVDGEDVGGEEAPAPVGDPLEHAANIAVAAVAAAPASRRRRSMLSG